MSQPARLQTVLLLQMTKNKKIAQNMAINQNVQICIKCTHLLSSRLPLFGMTIILLIVFSIFLSSLISGLDTNLERPGLGVNTGALPPYFDPLHLLCQRSSDTTTLSNLFRPTWTSCEQSSNGFSILKNGLTILKIKIQSTKPLYDFRNFESSFQFVT